MNKIFENRVELKRKQISDYSIKNALDKIDDSIYIENLKHLLEKKWRALASEKNQYNRKAKTFRFLSSKGYESDIIQDCFDEID